MDQWTCLFMTAITCISLAMLEAFQILRLRNPIVLFSLLATGSRAEQLQFHPPEAQAVFPLAVEEETYRVCHTVRSESRPLSVT